MGLAAGDGAETSSAGAWAAGCEAGELEESGDTWILFGCLCSGQTWPACVNWMEAAVTVVDFVRPNGETQSISRA